MTNVNPSNDNIKNLKPIVRGGKREGAGRPKGSKNIFSKDSVKKLEELEFDPIEKMVREYNEINKLLESGQVRIGSGAHAQLLSTKTTMINSLMQYGYKKVPEKQEIETTEKKPLSIMLNLKESINESREN